MAATEAVGDSFAAVPFTPCGIPYNQAVKFIETIAHSGDKLPAAVGRDSPKFIHESQTYVTMTHTTHTIHACVMAATRAAAKAMRDYALTRAMNHNLAINVAHAPTVVPVPDHLTHVVSSLIA